MQLEEKIKYMRIACGMTGIGLEDLHVDKLIHLYEAIMEKEGNFNLKDCVKIEIEAEERETNRRIAQAERKHDLRTDSNRPITQSI